MHIGIYINNENIAGINCSNLLDGNPGIGGTEYCILLLAQTYKIYYTNQKVTLFISKSGKLPKVDNYVTVTSLEELSTKAANEDVDILVVSAVYNGKPLPHSFFISIDQKKIKTILWGHNFYLNDFCNEVAKCSYIRGNVFVGRQQYDRYVDHQIIRKSTYIYNMYPEVKEQRFSLKNHNVTYIGSLVPAKGFHLLAKAWKTILAQIPDAELNVIGSGKLYGRNAKLGEYGIADEEYENSFMPGLLDESGKILDSVHFLGVLGTEKKNIILSTAVGVPNPSGRTETFGISALDFESMAVPVVTIKKGGFLDTVIDKKTGLLYSSTDELASNILELLNDKEKNVAYGKSGHELAKKFVPEKIIRQWHNLFETIQKEGKLTYQTPDSFLEDNLKRWRVANRKLKNALHIEGGFSVIWLETVAHNVLRRLGK